MATAEAASASEGHGSDGHGHDHDHGQFIAHHFTGPRQQYDSCKLGIWLFLVTEVLFFSGLFVAYTIYRYHHPEVFEEASKFLDTRLGALNTIVLLFSSLTMAWAVRAAQLEQRAVTTRSVLITIFCATVFLGVKAVEYSHKWGLGIFVAYFFKYDGAHHGDTNSYLTTLSIVPGICVVVCAALAGIGMATGKPLSGKFWGALALGLGGYFAGVGLGVGYEAVFASEGESHAEAGDHAAAADHAEGDAHTEAEHEHESTEALVMDPSSDEARNLGLFFSIYYFMTGLHAFHIIAGVIALAWIMNRSIQGHFRADYFGPVDYVGLYWHLVDLIWIYLFPLLYLIG
ncbi:MAG: cytochrome c oxidase subunit 3 [Pirellulaceae bacterium]